MTEAQFKADVIVKLRQSGVRAARGAHYQFDHLVPYAGRYIHAEGTCIDAAGNAHRAAVHIAATLATVGTGDVLVAAAEAARELAGCNLLVVCALSYTALARFIDWKGVTVLYARINPDVLNHYDL